MPLGAPAAAPAGWVQFCAKDRIECERGSPRADVQMASATATPDQGRASQAPTAATGDEGFEDQGQPGAFAWFGQAGAFRFGTTKDDAGLEKIEPGVFASLETPYLQPAGGRQATLTADMADDFGTASVPVSGDRRLSWANREAPNLHVQFASTYSLTLTPAEPVSTLSLSSGSWMTRRVGIDAAMGRLQAYRAAGQVTASGSTQLASGPLVLTQDLWNEVRTVNDRINRAILKRSDRELYGVDENWTLPLEAGVNAGDCEDFVLEKRRALLEA
ncbi:MAG: transglutaminase-like cysteine peptidase, partial [Verrucomicrobiota bacterium]